MDIDYNIVLSKCELTTSDKESLMKDRGFSEEVISELKLGSCGSRLVESLHVPRDLIHCLKRPAVVIPYFNKDGSITKVRPHKGGAKGGKVDIYTPWPLMDYKMPETIVIAESEFKAAASCIMGVPAIGVPGITSFYGKNFTELESFLSENGVKETIICFDNEIKSDPNHHNYKSDYTKRYDTMIYGYAMAKKLEHAGFKARIAHLHDEWMDDGKVDIDGFLASGRDPELYRVCISQSVGPKAYRSGWTIPKSHAGFIQRKLDRMFYKGPIEIGIDGYYYRNKKGDLEKVTNFKINVVHSRHTKDGVKRTVVFKGPYGTSERIELLPSHMSSKMNLQNLCYELGDYLYEGRDEHMKHLWKFLFIHQEGRYLHELDALGFLPEVDGYVFENGAYYNGKYSEKDDDGIVWVKDVGYKILPEAENDERVPSLCTEVITNFQLEDVKNHLAAVVGDHEAMMMLSWIIGHAFIKQIRADFAVFPWMFIAGKTGSGKTTLGNWFMNFWGQDVKGIPFEGSTQVGIQRAMTRKSDAPEWLDEFRHTHENGRKVNLLRSVYDKSTSVKGSKNANEVVKYIARATCLITGEDLSMDAAFMSRFLSFELFNVNKNQESYKWMEENKHLFSAIMHKFLMKADEMWPTVRENIMAYKTSLEDPRLKTPIENRIKTHYAVIAGVASTLFEGEALEDFDLFIGQMTKTIQNERSNEEALNVFWADVCDLYATDTIKFSFHKFDEDETEISIHFTALYAHWEKFCKRDRQALPIGRSILSKQMTSQLWCIENSRETSIPKSPGSLKNKKVRCFQLNANHEDLPKNLRDFITMLKTDPMDTELSDHQLKDITEGESSNDIF